MPQIRPTPTHRPHRPLLSRPPDGRQGSCSSSAPETNPHHRPMHSESSWGVVWVAELPTGLGAMNRCRSQWRNRGAEPGWRSSPGQRRVSVLVRQILGATTRWSPAGGCDGAARVGKAKAAAAGRRIGPGPKELPHPTDGENPQNSRKNPPSLSEDSSMDPSVPSHDLMPTKVEKSKKTKIRLTFLRF